MMLKIAMVLSVLFIQACGTAHIQSGVVSENLNEYSSAYIAQVDIQSKEQNGNSLKMNEKTKVYAEKKIKALIKNNNYLLLNNPPAADEASLGFKLDLDIIYGSRAARYWAGFGAGKGSVKSTFEVVDSKTGEIKYSASGASDLAVGAFGGSMETVIKKNIDELIRAYKVSPK